MMATFTPGYTFVDGEQVTPTKLNNLIDLATLSNLGYSNFGGSAGVLVYSSTAPPRTNGALWYDTTVGAEGLKYAFVSYSAASISKWLYLTPRRDMVCWTDAACSAHFPMFISRQGFRSNGSSTAGSDLVAYDGIPLLKIWSGVTGGATMPNVLMVIPTETASASSPVVCAWAGFIGTLFSNSPLSRGQPVVYDASSITGYFRSETYPAKSLTYGMLTQDYGASYSNAASIIWGSAAYEDRT